MQNPLQQADVNRDRLSSRMAACGALCTAAVSEAGVLWAWGAGEDGQLCGGGACRVMPARTGGPEVFGAPVVMVACGECHSAAAVEDGALWTWGDGEHGKLGTGDEEVCTPRPPRAPHPRRPIYSHLRHRL